MVFVVAAFGSDICQADALREPVQVRAFALGETVEVFLVVEWMMPDRSRRVLSRVDEELVVVLGIIATHPALWELAMFIFHRPTVLWWNAIASFGSFAAGGLFVRRR